MAEVNFESIDQIEGHLRGMLNGSTLGRLTVSTLSRRYIGTMFFPGEETVTALVSDPDDAGYRIGVAALFGKLEFSNVDGELLAALRNYAPALLDELSRLRSESRSNIDVVDGGSSPEAACGRVTRLEEAIRSTWRQGTCGMTHDPCCQFCGEDIRDGECCHDPECIVLTLSPIEVAK